MPPQHVDWSLNEHFLLKWWRQTAREKDYKGKFATCATNTSMWEMRTPRWTVSLSVQNEPDRISRWRCSIHEFKLSLNSLFLLPNGSNNVNVCQCKIQIVYQHKNMEEYHNDWICWGRVHCDHCGFIRPASSLSPLPPLISADILPSTSALPLPPTRQPPPSITNRKKKRKSPFRPRFRIFINRKTPYIFCPHPQFFEPSN